MITISDVAKEANVSVATVSRVINQSGKVKPETERRVNEAIDKLQYTINVSARNLRKNQSGVLLAVASNFTNPFYAKVLEGITDTASEEGYSVMVFASKDNPQIGSKCLWMLEGRQVDGVILLNCTDEDIPWLEDRASDYPIVQCCEYVPQICTTKVIVDHFKVGYEAVTFLASLGHRRIAFMGAENRHSSTLLRMEGYRKAVQDLDLEKDENLYVSAAANYSFDSGCFAAKSLLRSKDPPTAIFCVSDELARSCIFEANELGMQVPDDLSVVGCDDLGYTMMWHPFLTSFRLPCYEMGRESTRQLLDCIHGTVGEAREIILDTSLQIRESTGKVRSSMLSRIHTE